MSNTAGSSASSSGAASSSSSSAGAAKKKKKKKTEAVVNTALVDATTVDDVLDEADEDIDCLLMSVEESAKRTKMWEQRNADWEAKQKDKKRREEAVRFFPIISYD